MFKLFFKYLDEFLVFWMADLLIYRHTEEEHLIHLELVFEKIRVGIKLKMSKCEFFKNEIVYLWHLVSGQGIFPMGQKIKVITDPAPITNITEAQHMIGLIGYYRKFSSVFSHMTRPLNELTRKNVPFKWTKQCQKSFDYVKKVSTTNPILVYPDPDKQYYLFMDSSQQLWSGNLVHYTEQAKEDSTKCKVPHPITYHSRI